MAFFPFTRCERGPSAVRGNAQMRPRDLDRWAALGDGPRKLLVSACARLGLSARGYDRVRRLAATLRDLADVAEITDAHVAEAVQYRRRSLTAADLPPR